MAGGDDADIDPKLVKSFGLFRELERDPDGPLEDAERRTIEMMAGRFGKYDFARTAKVVLAGDLTFLVVPGVDGVLMLPPVRPGQPFSAAGARTETLLRGKPVGSSGSLVFGLAVDGVQLHSVELADRSTAEVPVRRNVFATNDPTRETP
ncbi:MAG TPA: hypothetical protein VFG00_06265 [Acidothermaceae bacterium]|nr:hypothetical protein [Acidothermaceae bacterium]